MISVFFCAPLPSVISASSPPHQEILEERNQESSCLAVAEHIYFQTALSAWHVRTTRSGLVWRPSLWMWTIWSTCSLTDVMVRLTSPFFYSFLCLFLAVLVGHLYADNFMWVGNIVWLCSVYFLVVISSFNGVFAHPDYLWPHIVVVSVMKNALI